MSETPRSSENISVIGYEEYESFLIQLDLLDEIIPKSETHAFYIWLSRRSEYANLQGRTIAEIFEDEVIKGETSEEDFFLWCDDSNLPTPYDVQGRVTEIGHEFNAFYDSETEARREQYERWAAENRIKTKDGSMMTFYNRTGTPRVLYTDFDRRGDITTEN